ncbi:MAG: hypothetical protein ACE5I1_21685 [bacterium]
MRGKHQIQLSFGLLSDYGVDNEVSAGSTTNFVGGGGLFGSVAYSYWVEHNLAIGITVGVLGSEVNTSINGREVSVETASVVPVLFGVKYQLGEMATSASLRPYLFASAGPCIGSATRSRAGTNLGSEILTETVLGAQLGLGAEVSLRRLFTLGANAGYFFASDFDKRIGSQKNYSSPQFMLSFGVALGNGKK